MNQSIELKISKDEINCIENNQIIWTLKISHLKFIGEYTTAQGPFLDDYYFVFSEKEKDWWQAPNQAIKNENFWTDLGIKLGQPIAPHLFASTDWKTNVLFPKNLEGQELFKLVQTGNSKRTFWQRLFGSGINNERLELTDNVKALFKNDP